MIAMPSLVTRTKRTVDVLKERQEMSLLSRLVVQSHRVACSCRIGTLSSSVSEKNTLAYVADILSCRSTRAMTVAIVDVSLPWEVEAGKTCRYMESPDGVFSCCLKMATACGLHVVHECVGAAYSEFLTQRMGLCDKVLERMPLSEATIKTMAHVLGDFLRLIISKEMLFQRTYFDCIPGKFVALVSKEDEQRQQALEFCRRPFEALGELEELVYTDRHAREYNTFLWRLVTWPREVLQRFTSATSTAVLVQLSLACTRS